MILLTRRERLLVAFVLTAFVVGAGVKHWRGVQAVTLSSGGMIQEDREY